jgi:hypothetical protein
MHSSIAARRQAQAPATRTMPTALSTVVHLDMLKRAINANLTARIEHDRRRQTPAGVSKIELINLADLVAADDNWLYLDEIISDPVRRALRVQLKTLGQRLFDLVGDTDRMRDVAEEVANQKPGPWGKRINIIDKAWDGIGNDQDRWIC